MSGAAAARRAVPPSVSKTRARASGGNSCSNFKNTPFVHPNPITLAVYPACTFASEDRVTTLYFSRNVPSFRKLSTIIPSQRSATVSASDVNPYRRNPSTVSS